MEKITICKKTFLDEQNRSYDLDYSMLIHIGEEGQTYGIAIEKKDANGTAEEERFFGISLRQKEVETFIRRLCAATALPVELAALCDDFISEKQWREAQRVILSAV